MAESFIRVNNLVKTYQSAQRPLQVLRGIDFELNKREFAAIIGPSGSGKTTFLNMLTGVDQPTEGDVVIGEMSVSHNKERRLTKWRARNIGVVFQFFQLLPTLSVADNVIAPMDFAKVHERKQRREIAMELLDRLDIADQADKTPDLLSGGQQQRVAIARALANEPPLIIADEMTANLDRMSAENVYKIMGEYAEKGNTVIAVSHNRRRVRDVPIIHGLHDGVLERTTIEEHRRQVAEDIKKFSAH